MKLRMGTIAFGLLGTSIVASHHAGADVAAPDLEATIDSWSEYNHDAWGSRTNLFEHDLRPSNVGGLKVKWAYPTGGSIYGTPVVLDNVVYFGDTSGVFYALTTSGQLVWKTQVNGPLSSAALVRGDRIVFGDVLANLYGLDRKTGAIAWTFHADPHPLAAIFGSPTAVGDDFVIGVASNEEDLNPKGAPFTTRGSVLRVHRETGAVVWQTYTVTDAQRAAGSSGASVWSSPTYDVTTNTLYVTTGNNFSAPTTTTSDAFMALDARTGAVRWVNQRTPNDTWNYNYPSSPAHPDADFGDSPQIYVLPGGRKVVGAGQKSGFYHVLDAATGAVVHVNQFEPGGALGGLFSDSAVDRGLVFLDGSNWPTPDLGTAPVSGDVIAVSLDGSKEVWRYSVPNSANLTGLAVANGVVYFQSIFDGMLHALDERTGAPLATVPIGASASGPSVAGGQVYVGTGALTVAGHTGAPPPGALIVLGL